MFWNSFLNTRVTYEDALKHIFTCENQGMSATTLSLSGALNLRPKKIVALIKKMEEKHLIRIAGDGIHLTPHGEAWALQVIRAHRLWESYLSDQVGLPLEEIHKRAERKEHTLTPEEIDDLEARLGFPQEDPHGDPIPSTTHELRQKESTALTDWPQGELGRIVHIEDEPHEIYTQIISQGLLINTHVKVLEVTETGLHIWTNLQQCWIPPIVAANIFVVKAPDWVKEVPAETLTTLQPGEHGKVLAVRARGLDRRRFYDLGITPGTIIQAVMPSALARPLAYEVRGAMIALRKDQTDNILIQRHDKEGLS